MSLALPDRALCACLLEYPGTDLHYETACLKGRNEVVRLHDTTLGVLPEQQRFDAAHHAGIEMDRRLKDEEEPIGVDRSVQIDVQLPSVLDGGLLRRRENDEA